MELNRMIDHTLLKADATPEQVEKLCREAKQHHFASVCVNACHVPLARDLLEGTDVKVCCVAGFPPGATLTAAKAYEAKRAVEAGAQEVDMVINIGFAKAGDWQRVEGDIRAVADAVHPDAILKVIIETCLLTDEEKVKACLAAKSAGADFVKTSTGFSTGGATAADIRLMRETVGPDMGVKASGGVRTREDALAMIEAGATRIGTSNGVKIVEGN
ncbi:MAG TPA: deoxyribose-phosphate aldolase [Clostridia bacterium]|nr:deoxyribose-phosphate aldolase [Clostridia bacterium]